MPSPEVLHELRSWFGEQPVAAQAVISLGFAVALVYFMLRYLASRDREASKAAAVTAAAMEASQATQKWMVETHVDQLRDLSQCMRESLNELTKAFGRSHQEHAAALSAAHQQTLRELERITEHLVQDSLRAVDRSTKAVEDFSKELERMRIRQALSEGENGRIS